MDATGFSCKSPHTFQARLIGIKPFPYFFKYFCDIPRLFLIVFPTLILLTNLISKITKCTEKLWGLFQKFMDWDHYSESEPVGRLVKVSFPKLRISHSIVTSLKGGVHYKRSTLYMNRTPKRGYFKFFLSCFTALTRNLNTTMKNS